MYAMYAMIYTDLFNKSFDILYFDGTLKYGAQPTRLFPGRFRNFDRSDVIKKLKSAGIDTKDMQTGGPKISKRSSRFPTAKRLSSKGDVSPKHKMAISTLFRSIGYLQSHLYRISSRISSSPTASPRLASPPQKVPRMASLSNVQNESSAMKMHRMGELAEREGNVERAVTLYREAFILKKRDYGAQHQSTVLSLSAYAHALTEAKSYDKAREAHELVIRIKKEVVGNAHISTAMSFAELGIVYYRQGHNDQAILEFRRALRSGGLAGKAQHVIMSMPLVFLGNALIRSDPKYKQEVRWCMMREYECRHPK